MIYQLPNGKIIHLTVEEYLDLTDQDIQYLMGVNAGDYSPSPFYESAIRKERKVEEARDIDTSIDYIPEDEDKSHGDNLPEEPPLLDDFPDFIDTDI